MNEKLLEKLKRVRVADVFHLLVFFVSIIPAMILKWIRPHIWLVCEKGEEARDNGYWFYKYLREERPEVDAVYAIKKDCCDYDKVKVLGECIPFGSFRHWTYYLAAELNISSQKDGKPNAAVCYLLEVVLGILRNKRVFLQHGVISNDLPFLHYEKAKMWLFCCGAKPEYEFVKREFGYPDGSVVYTGLCRFDSLHGLVADEDLILVLPTWRMNLQRLEDVDGFKGTEYYKAWQALLSDQEVQSFLESNRKRMVFCLHRNMEAFEDLFVSPSDRIMVVKWKDADIQNLIKTAGLLITDYSSIFMDFAYMRKPVIYYQFDYDSFRSNHLPEGYFDFKRDGFGDVCVSVQEVKRSLEVSMDSRTADNKYTSRSQAFFPLHDCNNCSRTYNAIITSLTKNG